MAGGGAYSNHLRGLDRCSGLSGPPKCLDMPSDARVSLSGLHREPIPRRRSIPGSRSSLPSSSALLDSAIHPEELIPKELEPLPDRAFVFHRHEHLQKGFGYLDLAERGVAERAETSQARAVNPRVRIGLNFARWRKFRVSSVPSRPPQSRAGTFSFTPANRRCYLIAFRICL